MPRISQSALAQVREALREYDEEVNNSKLSLESKAAYVAHAKQFVRWLEHDLEPGIHSPAKE